MRKIPIIIVTILCVGIFAIPATRSIFSRAVFFIVRPLLMRGIEMSNSLNTFGDYVHSYSKLLADIQELKDENLRLKAELIDYEVTKRENSDFAKSIAFVRSQPHGFTASRVIGDFTDPSGLFLVINGGTDDGIPGGALVLSGERALLGRISELHSTTATVSLLRNAGSTLGVFIVPRHDIGTTTPSTRTLTEGLLIGKGDGMIIDLVPNSADIRRGDLVVTNGSGEGGIRDLLVGEVAEVRKKDATIFQEIYVREVLSASEVRSVLIVTDKRK